MVEDLSSCGHQTLEFHTGVIRITPLFPFICSHLKQISYFFFFFFVFFKETLYLCNKLC